MPFGIKLPWQKEEAAKAPVDPATCTHPRVEVEMRGPVVKRRRCAICGADLAEQKQKT